MNLGLYILTVGNSPVERFLKVPVSCERKRDTRKVWLDELVVDCVIESLVFKTLSAPCPENPPSAGDNLLGQ
jgi:hypothetical protein